MVRVKDSSQIIIGLSGKKLRSLDGLGVSYNINPVLLRDSNGKPKLQLRDSKDTAIATPTQSEFDTLMQVYECGGMIWHDGTFPTESDCIAILPIENTCITFESYFSSSEKDYYLKRHYSIINPQKFYSKQNITPKMIKEINNWFEKFKPDRVSKLR